MICGFATLFPFKLGRKCMHKLIMSLSVQKVEGKLQKDYLQFNKYFTKQVTFLFLPHKGRKPIEGNFKSTLTSYDVGRALISLNSLIYVDYDFKYSIKYRFQVVGNYTSNRKLWSILKYKKWKCSSLWILIYKSG